jgi:outer membrane protein TolC
MWRRRVGPGAALVIGLALASGARATDAEVTLPEVARQAIAANLDLVAKRQALGAAREEIGLARSALLPQVGLGARAQVLDTERSDSARGNNKSRSVLLVAGLQQVLYDEKSWAGLEIEKHTYEGQARQLDGFQLGIVQDAAFAFLAFDRAQRLLEIQRRNREVTRRNLETSRSRIAAGWSSDREVLRWEAQLAADDTSVRAAEVRVLQTRFALNRVRNLAPESPVAARPSTIDEYGFLYARAPIAEAVARPENDRLLRDFFVRVGLRRSPDLAALDASIAAAERQLVASRRAFWVPSLGLAAGVDHLANGGSGEDFNQTEWGVKGELTFPLFLGGGKFAGLEQARQTLASLRTQRTAAAQSLEQSIRSAFAQTTGSYESTRYAGRQTEAARRNFDLVDASYRLGVASILDLLDAQEQLLEAELGELDAIYGFLDDVVSAERAVSFYAFLEPRGDVDALLEQFETELGVQP